jgi:hypothetical protein
MSICAEVSELNLREHDMAARALTEKLHELRCPVCGESGHKSSRL